MDLDMRVGGRSRDESSVSGSHTCSRFRARLVSPRPESTLMIGIAPERIREPILLMPRLKRRWPNTGIKLGDKVFHPLTSAHNDPRR